VLADEGAAAAERLDRAVDVDGAVGQLPLALAGVAEQRADAAVDVEQRVGPGGTGAGGEGVELVAVLAQRAGEGLQQRGALVEGPRQLAARAP